MFEYLIIKKKDNFIEIPPIVRPQLINQNYKILEKNIGKIFLQILYFKNIDEFIYENEHSLILILGSVYSKYIENNHIKELFAKDIFALDLSINIIDLRGHFQVIYINKITEEIKIYNDLYGLKPCYYGSNHSFYFIGNSLSVLRNFSSEIDESSLLEKLVFEHCLLDNTIYKNIKTLYEASILKLNDKYEILRYFSWYNYFENISVKEKFSYNKYIDMFNRICKSRGNDNDINLVTITGGHDGRAVASAFLKNNQKIASFSFGRPGSENTKIPEIIANKIGFNHQSVYLLEDFENNYFNNSIITNWLSDGELLFNQQTTLYAVSKLAHKQRKLFTGLLAGELLGPVHLKCDYLNEAYYKYIYDQIEFSIHSIYPELITFLKSDNIEHLIDNVKAHILEREKMLSGVRKSSNSHLFSLCDMITWGFRKFYAYQMHLMRYYLENIPVFCDFDLMDYLLSSDYNKIYKNSYKSLYKRRNSRKLQLNIINSNSNDLSCINLDRGYSPKMAKNVFLIPIKLFLYFKRKYKNSHGKYIPDFKTDEWSKTVIEKIRELDEIGDQRIKSFNYNIDILIKNKKSIDRNFIKNLSLILYLNSNNFFTKNY